MEWSHSTLGKFDISEQWIGLDFRNLFLDPLRAETTLIHEMTHSLIGQTTEMGQAMQNVTFFMPKFEHLTLEQKNEIHACLMKCQTFSQEGFATFMEMQQLRKKTSLGNIQLAKDQMPPAYRSRFERMEFMMHKKNKVRERFTKKISMLVMNNGFRIAAPGLDLLRSPESIKNYFDYPDHNPDARLEKVLVALRKNERILRKKPRKIAKMCGLEFFEPASAQEVVRFVNYLLGLAKMEQDYTLEMVGRTINKEPQANVIDNLLVTNMNLDLVQTGMMIWEDEDIQFEASHSQATFIVEHTHIEDQELLESKFKRKFEVDLVLFSKGGEKYMAATSFENSQQLLLNELKDSTVITKWGICNPVNGSFSISKTRKPSIIVYNRPADMLNTFQRHKDGIKKYEYIHIGMSQDHPFQSLIVKVNGLESLHFVNGFGNAGISELIRLMKPKGRQMKPDELAKHSRELNDMFAVLGMPWDVDWIATMIDQNNIIKR